MFRLIVFSTGIFFFTIMGVVCFKAYSRTSTRIPIDVADLFLILKDKK